MKNKLELIEIKKNQMGRKLVSKGLISESWWFLSLNRKFWWQITQLTQLFSLDLCQTIDISAMMILFMLR